MLLIVIVSVIFYVYIISYTGEVEKAKSEKSVRLKIEGVKASGNKVTLYVHNIGQSKAKVDKVYLLDPATENVVAAISVTPVEIRPGEIKDVSAELPKDLKPGKYLLAVGTAEGAKATYSKAVSLAREAVEIHVSASPGEDLGDPKYGVKKAEISYRVEAGVNTTYVTLKVPRGHWVRFSPVLCFTADTDSLVQLTANTITSSASVNIFVKIGDSTQIVVDNSNIKQKSGEALSISAGEKIELSVKVFVSSEAKLGAEVAKLETMLEYSGGGASTQVKIIWIIETFSKPPKVVLFSEDFETGSLVGWSKTRYVYVKKKTGDIVVHDYCPGHRKATDKTRPISGSWVMMLGHRDLHCEPWKSLNDYASMTIEVPAEIDGVEVKHVKISLYLRVLSWDSAYYDYVTVSVKAGGKTYYLISRYNPNPKYYYGPFRDSGWKHLSKTIEGVAETKLILKILLHTFSDNWLKTWVYVDDIEVVVEFG